MNVGSIYLYARSLGFTSFGISIGQKEGGLHRVEWSGFINGHRYGAAMEPNEAFVETAVEQLLASTQETLKTIAEEAAKSPPADPVAQVESLDSSELNTLKGLTRLAVTATAGLLRFAAQQGVQGDDNIIEYLVAVVRGVVGIVAMQTRQTEVQVLERCRSLVTAHMPKPG